MTSVGSKRVAFIGIGQIGAPMCDRVIGAGYQVTVFDPSEEAMRGRELLGAATAASPARAADGAGVICIVVRDDLQAMESIAGIGGVLEGSPASEAVVLLHSTVAISTVHKLSALCSERNLRFVDAGVSGGASGAMDGSLYVMCGGDVDAVEDARPILETFGGHVVRFGETGAGMATKLARNLIQFSLFGVIGEGIDIIEAYGVDFEAFAHMYRHSQIASGDYFLEFRAPQAVNTRTEDDDHRTGQLVELGLKDLKNGIQLASEVGTETPFAALARERLGLIFGLGMDPND
jgi:3-hydroxyisobutyrate dehydrogenase